MTSCISRSTRNLKIAPCRLRKLSVAAHPVLRAGTETTFCRRTLSRFIRAPTAVVLLATRRRRSLLLCILILSVSGRIDSTTRLQDILVRVYSLAASFNSSRSRKSCALRDNRILLRTSFKKDAASSLPSNGQHAVQLPTVV